MGDAEDLWPFRFHSVTSFDKIGLTYFIIFKEWRNEN